MKRHPKWFNEIWVIVDGVRFQVANLDSINAFCIMPARLIDLSRGKGAYKRYDLKAYFKAPNEDPYVIDNSMRFLDEEALDTVSHFVTVEKEVEQ